MGGSHVIPGFDQAVQDMEINQEKKVLINFQDAYGPVRDDLSREYPKDMLGGQEVTEGQELWFKSPQGPVPGRVMDLGDTSMTVDSTTPWPARIWNSPSTVPTL